MVKLPTADQINVQAPTPTRATNLGHTARAAATAAQAEGQVWRQVGGIGRDMQLIGEAIQKREDERDDAPMPRLGITQLTNNEAVTYDTNLQNMEPGDRQFSARNIADQRQRFDAFLETLPDHLRAKYAVVLEQKHGQYMRQYDAAENEMLRQHHKTQFGDALDVSLQNVANNPARLDEMWEQAEATIYAIPDDELSPLDKEELLRATRQDLVAAATRGHFDSNPAQTIRNLRAPAGGNAMTSYNYFKQSGFNDLFAAALVGRLMVESYDRLDPNARLAGDGKDGSDSIGIMQWNAERARALKSFAKKTGRPWNDRGVQLEFAVQEILQHPDIAQRAQTASSAEEALRVVFDHIRPGGWVEGGDLTKINGFKETVENMQAILGGEMGNAAYEDLDFATRQKLADGYESEYNKILKAEYAANKDAMTLDMSLNAYESFKDLFEDPRFEMLDDGDKALFIDKLETELGKGADARAMLQMIESGGGGQMKLPRFRHARHRR